VETRNACTAGYKAIWHARDGFPSPDYFAALHPHMRNVIADKMSTHMMNLGQRAGGLTPEMARPRACAPAPPWRWPTWTLTWRCPPPPWWSPISWS
jgi:L-ribulokinase